MHSELHQEQSPSPGELPCDSGSLFCPSSHPLLHPGPNSACPLYPGSPARFPSASGSQPFMPSFRHVFLFPGTRARDMWKGLGPEPFLWRVCSSAASSRDHLWDPQKTCLSCLSLPYHHHMAPTFLEVGEKWSPWAWLLANPGKALVSPGQFLD